MNKIFVILFILFSFSFKETPSEQLTTNQGQISFFSYTSVENIEAQNNQVLSLIDLSSNEVAINILMNAFVFKKALMREHFNESYIESDLYPKATFEGEILDFNSQEREPQTKMIKGTLTMRNQSKEYTIKTDIEYKEGVYFFSGDFDILVEDFKIEIPPLLVPNIAKVINTKFKFQYQLNEK